MSLQSDRQPSQRLLDQKKAMVPAIHIDSNLRNVIALAMVIPPDTNQRAKCNRAAVATRIPSHSRTVMNKNSNLLLKLTDQTMPLLLVGIFSLARLAGAQDLVVTDRGPHHAIWERVSERTRAYG